MKALVTGGAGFIGTNLIKRLLKDGDKVISLDNYSSGLKENEVDGCNYIDINLCQMGELEFAEENRPDVIFHMAALARIQPSLKNPHMTLYNNFLSTLNILEHARQTNTKVVYSGSSSVHHGLQDSPYAWSKWNGEELCKLYHNVYGLDVSICRFYNVYGPHQLTEGDYCTVVGIFESLYKEGKPLTITGDGEQRRDFTHVDDIVDGIVLTSEKYFEECEVFELGRGKNFSINEIANMFGENYPKKYIDARLGEYPTTLCEDRSLPNWKPVRNIEDYIKDFVETEKFLNE